MTGETHISSTHAQTRSPLTNLFPLYLKINSPHTENNFILTRPKYTDQRTKNGLSYIFLTPFHHSHPTCCFTKFWDEQCQFFYWIWLPLILKKQVFLRNIFFKKTSSPVNVFLSKIKFHEKFLSKMKVNYGRTGESQLTCMFGKFFKQFISISILGYISHK